MEFEFDRDGVCYKFALDEYGMVRSYKFETRYLAPAWVNMGPHDCIDSDGIRALLAAITDRDQKLAAQAKRIADYNEALDYLTRLFKSCAPQCEPFNNLSGLATQIDNYIAGRDERIAELERDFEQIDEAVAEVYCNITNGRFSKANTDPLAILDVVQELEEKQNESWKQRIAELERSIDSISESCGGWKESALKLEAALAQSKAECERLKGQQ